jgi:hypothetical protein
MLSRGQRQRLVDTWREQGIRGRELGIVVRHLVNAAIVRQGFCSRLPPKVHLIYRRSAVLYSVALSRLKTCSAASDAVSQL